MIALATFALAGCLSVGPGADHILFRDLAAAFPPEAGLPPETSVALAPAPGAQRIFHLPELRRLAMRLHWAAEPQSEICVERAVAPPNPARLLAAMQKEMPAARIEILDYSRQALPEGEIQFPAAGLHSASPPEGRDALWTGFVCYAGHLRFHTWARVKVTVVVTQVLAVSDLVPGQPIAPVQLRQETREGFPAATPLAGSLEDVADKWPLVPIRAGAAIRTDQLQSPRAVTRGQMVAVDIHDGAARLELVARAEAAGGLGETIPVFNLASHRRFAARIVGKGRVSVDSSLSKVNP